MSIAIPSATASGKLPGNVDCYILEDGQRVIAQRAILRSLRNSGETSGVKDGNFARILARLQKRFAHLTSGAGVEFSIPWSQGGAGRAIGRPPSLFVGVLRAYVEAFAADELHKSQHRIARRATQLLALLAEKGIEAMIDEACGVVQRVPADSPASPVPRTLAVRINLAEHVVEALRAGDVAEAVTANAALAVLLGPSSVQPRPHDPQARQDLGPRCERPRADADPKPPPPASATPRARRVAKKPSGDAVRALRKSLGMTQEEAAAKAQLGRVEITRVETGHNQANSHRIRAGLARAFQLAIDDVSAYLDGAIDLDEALRRRHAAVH